MLLRQPFDFEGKNPTKHLSDGSQSQLPKPEPSRGRAGNLLLPAARPAAPPPLSAGMQSGPNFRGRPIARRPASRDVSARGGHGRPGVSQLQLLAGASCLLDADVSQ